VRRAEKKIEREQLLQGGLTSEDLSGADSEVAIAKTLSAMRAGGDRVQGGAWHSV